MKTVTRTFWSDPGHGWLEVPLEDVRELGIAAKISLYSYINSKPYGGVTSPGQYPKVYLEEDCDAAVYMNAAKEAGWEVKIQEREDTRGSIRNMNSYKLDVVLGALS